MSWVLIRDLKLHPFTLQTIFHLNQWNPIIHIDDLYKCTKIIYDDLFYRLENQQISRQDYEKTIKRLSELDERFLTKPQTYKEFVYFKLSDFKKPFKTFLDEPEEYLANWKLEFKSKKGNHYVEIDYWHQDVIDGELVWIVPNDEDIKIYKYDDVEDLGKPFDSNFWGYEKPIDFEKTFGVKAYELPKEFYKNSNKKPINPENLKLVKG